MVNPKLFDIIIGVVGQWDANVAYMVWFNQGVSHLCSNEEHLVLNENFGYIMGICPGCGSPDNLVIFDCFKFVVKPGDVKALTRATK